jgi:hypothetical protein
VYSNSPHGAYPLAHITSFKPPSGMLKVIDNPGMDNMGFLPILWVIFGVVGASMGRLRGSASEGLVLGLLLGPIGLLMLLFQKQQSKEERRAEALARLDAAEARRARAIEDLRRRGIDGA